MWSEHSGSRRKAEKMTKKQIILKHRVTNKCCFRMNYFIISIILVMDGVVSLKSPHVVEFEFCDLREL